LVRLFFTFLLPFEEVGLDTMRVDHITNEIEKVEMVKKRKKREKRRNEKREEKKANRIDCA